MRDGSASIYETELAYDPVGNRLSQNHTTGQTSVLTSYTYDERDRLLVDGGTEISWDANGNLAERVGEASYSWESSPAAAATGSRLGARDPRTGAAGTRVSGPGTRASACVRPPPPSDLRSEIIDPPGGRSLAISRGHA